MPTGAPARTEDKGVGLPLRAHPSTYMCLHKDTFWSLGSLLEVELVVDCSHSHTTLIWESGACPQKRFLPVTSEIALSQNRMRWK